MTGWFDIERVGNSLKWQSQLDLDQDVAGMIEGGLQCGQGPADMRVEYYSACHQAVRGDWRHLRR